MTTVIVWLLIAVSTGTYNRGTVTVVGSFATVTDCQAVRKHIPGNNTDTACVQAKLLR